MNNKLLILCFLLLPVSVFSSSDSQPQYIPVSIKDSRLSLKNLIKFPKKQAKSKEDIAVVVRCDAFIKRNGKVSSNVCYESGDIHYPYVTKINRAAKSAVFNPGKVNGITKMVYFQYYVLFVKKGKSTSIEVIGNSGLEVEKYGFDYSSAQRYQESSGNFGTGCGHNKQLTVNAVISETGLVSSIDIVGDNLGNKCIKYLKKSFQNQMFIPAIFEGKAVSSFYSERIFNVMRQQ